MPEQPKSFRWSDAVGREIGMDLRPAQSVVVALGVVMATQAEVGLISVKWAFGAAAWLRQRTGIVVTDGAWIGVGLFDSGTLTFIEPGMWVVNVLNLAGAGSPEGPSECAVPLPGNKPIPVDFGCASCHHPRSNHAPDREAAEKFGGCFGTVAVSAAYPEMMRRRCNCLEYAEVGINVNITAMDAESVNKMLGSSETKEAMERVIRDAILPETAAYEQVNGWRRATEEEERTVMEFLADRPLPREIEVGHVVNLSANGPTFVHAGRERGWWVPRASEQSTVAVSWCAARRRVAAALGLDLGPCQCWTCRASRACREYRDEVNGFVGWDIGELLAAERRLANERESMARAALPFRETEAYRDSALEAIRGEIEFRNLGPEAARARLAAWRERRA